MASQIELEIQRRLLQYLSGEIELDQFEDWFVPVLWDIDEYDECAREMAGRVHNLISEFSHGDRSLESLREELEHTAMPSSVAQSRHH